MKTSRVHLHSAGKYWQAFWTDGQGNPHKKSLGPKSSVSKRQAVAKCRGLEAEISRSPLARSGSNAPGLRAWLGRYMALRTDLKAGSRAVYKNVEDSLLEYFDDVAIDQITRADAAEWRLWLASPATVTQTAWPSPGRGLSDASVCKYIRAAKAIFGERHGAMKFDLLAVNPFERERGVADDPEKDWQELTAEEVQRLMEAAPTPPWRALVGLCALAGLRKGEAFLLQWPDIQWEKNRLIVTSEKRTGRRPKKRECLMVPELARVLLDAQEQATGSRVVAMSRNNLQRDIKVIMKRADLPPWSAPFHTLRKWRDTTWKMKYPEYVVDAWLGHSMEVSRRHYVRPPESLYDQDTPRQRLDAILEQLPGAELTRLEKIAACLLRRSSPQKSPQSNLDRS